MNPIRASRRLRPDIDVFKVGPFTYEVVEPLNKVRFTLDENEYGLSCDVTLEGTSPLFEETPAQYQVERGRVKEHIKRMIQSGRPTGWIKTDEGTVTLDKENWVGERDRSWGIRPVGGGDPRGAPPQRSGGAKVRAASAPLVPGCACKGVASAAN